MQPYAEWVTVILQCHGSLLDAQTLGSWGKKLEFFPVPETTSPRKEWAQFESQILHSSDDFEFFTSASKKPIPNPTAFKAGLAHCFPGLWLCEVAEELRPSCPFLLYSLTGNVRMQRAAVLLSLWILMKNWCCAHVAHVICSNL